MSYELVISPTAEASLDRILTKYPFPELYEEFRKACRAIANDPADFLRRHPARGLLPWFIVNYRRADLWVYMQVFFRFLPDEQRIEIADIRSLLL